MGYLFDIRNEMGRPRGTIPKSKSREVLEVVKEQHPYHPSKASGVKNASFSTSQALRNKSIIFI